jgi:hypothetical protein
VWRGLWAIDRRFLLPAFVLGLLALRLDLRGRAARLAYAVMTAAVLMRAGHVEIVWQRLSRRAAEQVAFLDHIPRGSHFGKLMGPPADRTTAYDALWMHLPTWAVVTREATTHELFGAPGQMPLVRRGPRVAESIWAYRAGPEAAAALAARCREARTLEPVTIYLGCAAAATAGP